MKCVSKYETKAVFANSVNTIEVTQNKMLLNYIECRKFEPPLYVQPSRSQPNLSFFRTPQLSDNF